MKKSIMISAACLALAACSNESYVDENFATGNGKEAPIGFTIRQKNITRASTYTLDQTGHYNFGVWAAKVNSTSDDQKIMDNYLVGFGGDKVGYDHTNATTWNTEVGSLTDHTSPWFYEKLGNTEYGYTGTDGYYTTSDTKYLSANANQYLKYWDLAYANTYFYAYTPYQKEGVTLVWGTGGAATLKLATGAIRDGYDKPLNSTYKASGTTPAQDRTLSEFMYASKKATNSALNDVELDFKRIGAQLFIRFYEDLPGYKVEVLDLDVDGTTFKTGISGDVTKGIQATPSVVTAGTPNTYAKGTYFTSASATVAFGTDGVGTLTNSTTGETGVNTNLMFLAPSITATDYMTTNIPTGYGSVENKNWKKIESTQSTTTTHYVIPEYAGTGTQSDFAWSPTIYYPVAQPTTQKTGFTFHVSYRIISDDKKEVTTVHNATVFVPSDVTTWASNTRYIYTFKITKNSTGSTDPTPSEGYDPTSPTPDVKKSLYPIVFDACTITDYTENATEHVISNGTTY